MHIKIRQFQIFAAVAHHLSYTRAAEVLHLSQPAVSMQIKQLEEEVEMPLFERMGKRLLLTEAGNELLKYANNISQQLIELDDVMSDIRGGGRRGITIAVATTANYFALKLLGEFYKRFSGTNINLFVTNREGLLEHLNDNTVDMAIMGQPPKGMHVEATRFMENPLVVIAPKGHKLSKQKNIPLSALQQEVFIMREHGSGTRIAVERFFEGTDCSISSAMEISSNEAINQAVEAGLGLGIVSHHTLELELALDRLEVLDIESFPIMRHWYLVQRKGKRLTVLMDEFKQLVINEAGKILQR